VCKLNPVKHCHGVCGIVPCCIAAVKPKRLGANRTAELVCFNSGALELKGFVWKPSGEGPGAREGHSFCVRGTEILGPDALRFIETYLK